MVSLIPFERSVSQNIPFLLASFNTNFYTDIYSTTTTINKYTTLKTNGIYSIYQLVQPSTIIINENTGQMKGLYIDNFIIYIINGNYLSETNIFKEYNIIQFELFIIQSPPNNKTDILYKLVNTNNKKTLKNIKKYINDL